MSDAPQVPPQRISLRELPLPARLVLSLFLISAGVSYFYGLMQVHFQDADHGQLLPDDKAQREKFAGTEGVSILERVLIAPEHKPFGSSGTMRPAFFKKSAGWPKAIRTRAKDAMVDATQAEQLVRADRLVELDAVLEWIRAGGTEATYASFPLSEKLAANQQLPNLDSEMFAQDNNKWHAKIATIVEVRCVRCHSPEAGGPAGQIHLNDFAAVKDYLDPQKGGGLSLQKRAQTTHVHAFGFSMLYAMTGLILALSTYPVLLRLLLCPLPLLAMVLELACWWLPLANPLFSNFVEPLAVASATGLMLHIVLSLLNMYGVAGKLVLLLLFLLAGGGGFVLKTQVVDPYLVKESAAAK